MFQKSLYPDLLATSGDFLRIWQLHSDGNIRMECFLNNVNHDERWCVWRNVRFPVCRIRTRTFALHWPASIGTKWIRIFWVLPASIQPAQSGDLRYYCYYKRNICVDENQSTVLSCCAITRIRSHGALFVSDWSGYWTGYCRFWKRAYSVDCSR